MTNPSPIPEARVAIKNLLLTGTPGCGKTTVVERATQHLRNLRLAGFVTREVREHGQRVAFEAVGVSGGRAVIAHVRFRSNVSVGRYGVQPDRLVPLVERELERQPGTVDAYLIDEIGKMECLCPRFVAALRRILDGPVPLVATIGSRSGGFIAEVKKRPDVQIVEVTHENRQSLPEQVAYWVNGRVTPTNTR